MVVDRYMKRKEHDRSARILPGDFRGMNATEL